MSEYGVTCNAIRPRAWTRMSADPKWDVKIEQLRARADEDPGALQMLRKYEAAKHWVPEDVAPFVVYLATDEAENVSGCVFIVGGSEITLQKTMLVGSMWAEGRWTVDSIAKVFPQSLGQGLGKPDRNAPPG